MLDPRVIDPGQELVRREELADRDLDQIVRVMEALRRWREADRRASEASRRYMRLGETDMRAIRYLIAAGHHGRPVTPGALAGHLKISTASTTKLLDRLVEGGHVLRHPHPSDRRSVVIEVTAATRRTARLTVGRRHARRFGVISRLSPAERELVAVFLEDLAHTVDEE
ncbi:MarR family transcriptional regulator [Myceligenerans xiligouense]|uniref:MarR family transcriptional regulator n=2 Tax=Myceligenerans xiligouense TaxID=253184 RepID=A0A3N4ZLS5_9MICO|nr:MarR family transcriptional regulator [Myceligenerans xiligouense]